MVSKNDKLLHFHQKYPLYPHLKGQDVLRPMHLVENFCIPNVLASIEATNRIKRGKIAKVTLTCKDLDICPWSQK